MTDPFEQLRATDTSSMEPDFEALKARARRIQRRRQTVLVAGPLAIAIIAGAGIFLRAGLDDRIADQASAPTQAEKSQPAPLTADEAKDSGTQLRAGAPAAESSGSADQVAGANATMGSAESEMQALQATLEVKPATVGRGARFTLKVCNASELTVEQSFGTAQRYDFIVSRNDEVVWQWSEGRSFASVRGTETWAPKECKQWTDDWDGMTSTGEIAPPGEYEGLGMLTTDPQVITESKKFCLDIC